MEEIIAKNVLVFLVEWRLLAKEKTKERLLVFLVELEKSKPLDETSNFDGTKASPIGERISRNVLVLLVELEN